MKLSAKGVSDELAKQAYGSALRGMIPPRSTQSDAIVRSDESINAQSTLALFQEIEARNPNAERIYMICDNARFDHAQPVKDYVENSKIEMLFPPPYAPNLNSIERFWKVFKKNVWYGRYDEPSANSKPLAMTVFPGWIVITTPCARY